MTREEAIQVLESMKSEESYNALIDLCNMAIEALSAQQTDLISRADAIEAVRWETSKLGRGLLGKGDILDIIEALPSAEAEPTMTEEVREALMRLTMCAREECGMCKYKDECDFDFQYKISTDNMNTLSDALLRSKCEVDAKLADAVQGEWKCMADCGVTECDQCGWSIEEYVGDYNYCPNCGARMKGGDDE